MISLAQISQMFNRSIAYIFTIPKLLFVFTTLSLLGLIVVFFRGLSIGAHPWVSMSLTFLPFFLCAAVLLSLGVFLIRLYHNEVKGKVDQYMTILNHSWEVIIGASYFSIPIIISYLVLWIASGFFILLWQIPGIGEVLGIIFAFGPFLVNLSVLILCITNIGLLFFLTPLIALKGIDRASIIQAFTNRIKGDVFSHVILLFFALLPAVVVGALLMIATFMTTSTCTYCQHPLSEVLYSFFLMLPFAALMTPTVIFFFNFAAEAHVLAAKAK